MSATFDTDIEPGRLKEGPVNTHRYHKDSLNRYVDLDKDPQNDKDHYLRPKDGKLGVVKVQLAPGFVPRKTVGTTTWTTSGFKSDSGIRDVPIGILKWAYRDYVEGQGRDTSQLWWKYPIAALGLTFTVCPSKTAT